MFPGTDFFQLSSKTFPTDLPILHPHPLFTCYNKKKTEEEGTIMNPEKAKMLAHEFTMSYINANSDKMLSESKSIPEIVNNIANINQEFYDEITKKRRFDDLF